jgi:DNA repair protein RadC
MNKKDYNLLKYKLLANGTSILSDVDVLSLVIKGKNSDVLSFKLLKKMNNVYGNLAKLSFFDLCKEGLSIGQAMSVIASFETSKRRGTISDDKIQIKCSTDIFDIFQPLFQDLNVESFWVAYLSRNNKILDKYHLSIGGLSGTVTDTQLVIKRALDNAASGIILCHNHPSGNLNPSESDKKITDKIKSAGLLMDIQLMDHLIIANDKYYSFADSGDL